MHITPIFKHGDRKNFDNHCATSVTRNFSRMYGRIVRDLIETEYSDKEAEEQAGFGAGRSRNDNTFRVCNSVQHHIFNKSTNPMHQSLKFIACR